LDDAGSVGRRAQATLIKNQCVRRNLRGPDDAEAAGRNFD
jgi:hypothetical protein